MFFVGFGGQYLPLLLTVIMPLLVLFSGSKSLSTNDIIQQKISISEFKSQDTKGIAAVCIFIDTQFIIKKPTIIPIYPNSTKIKIKYSIPISFSRHIGASGNKAPPFCS